MRLLVSDANILIDVEDGRVVEPAFALPYQLVVPDTLFYEELEDQHETLVEYGLWVHSLTPESMEYVQAVIRREPKPGRNDCMALGLARQEQCPLLTGDQDLRHLAESEGIEVRGTIWLVEELVRHELISKNEAFAAYQRMEAAGSRLPWAEARRRLARLPD